MLLSVLLAPLLAAALGNDVAQAPAPPVQLNMCSLLYDNTSSLAAQVSGLAAKFTNNSSKVARVVNIRADINGTSQIIRDEGTFSPGIEIDHRYRVARGQFALPMILNSLFGKPSVRCDVDSVEFTDGTRWPQAGNATSAQATQPSNPSAISVTPATLELRLSAPGNSQLVLARGGGSLALNSDCGKVADVQILATTGNELSLKIAAKAPGSCTITVRDINDNIATLPVTISP